MHDADEPRKPRAPRRMSDLIPQLMARRGYARILSHDVYAAAWDEASGDLRRQSRAGRLRRGVLEVVASNSLVLQELTFQKRQILATIQRLLPDQRIRDLRFTVGNFD
jgi:predicted nucleic acid-binding Zn ribbon protein